MNNFPGPKNRYEQIGITSVLRNRHLNFCFNVHDVAGLGNAVISFVDRVRNESPVGLMKPADLQ